MILLQRLGYVLLMLLVCFDITVQVIWRGFFLYLPFGKSKPSARETISGWMGRAAADGYWWGIGGARFINWLFRNPGHCAEAAATEAGVQTNPYD